MSNPLIKSRTLGLAPMEGLIDPPMREILTQACHFDYCVTEFIRVVDQLLPERVFYKLCPELSQGGLTASGVPVHVQILGSHPTAMAENAARAAELSAPAIDINFGCPAKTVNRNQGGAALLNNPELIHKTLASVRNAVSRSILITAKMRLGLCDRDRDRALDIALACEAAGASWITVHARTRDQGYRPPVYWSDLHPLQTVLTIPVVANGDINTPEDAARCRNLSGCQHLMIGRGAVRNPFLSHQLAAGDSVEWGWPAAKQVLMKYHDMTESIISHPHFLLGRLKQWLAFFRMDLPEAQHFFNECKREKDLKRFMQHLHEWEAIPEI